MINKQQFIKKSKNAFTLAEVLITLGIIGVVAALTIPMLITSIQKHSIASALREAQSILNQAVKMYAAETDEEGSLDFDVSLTEQEFAEKYFVPYLKVARICTSMEDGCWETGDFYGYYDLAGVKMKDKTPYSIVLNNGMILGFNKVASGSSYALISILVDLDGKGKRNTLGRDVQSFFLFNNSGMVKGTTSYMNNGIYPGGFGCNGIPHVQYTREELLGTNVTRGCNKNMGSSSGGCSNYGGTRPGAGAGCAAVIFKDGWQIRSDYPW